MRSTTRFAPRELQGADFTRTRQMTTDPSKKNDPVRYRIHLKWVRRNVKRTPNEVNSAEMVDPSKSVRDRSKLTSLGFSSTVKSSSPPRKLSVQLNQSQWVRSPPQLVQSATVNPISSKTKYIIPWCGENSCLTYFYGLFPSTFFKFALQICLFL